MGKKDDWAKSFTFSVKQRLYAFLKNTCKIFFIDIIEVKNSDCYSSSAAFRSVSCDRRSKMIVRPYESRKEKSQPQKDRNDTERL